MKHVTSLSAVSEEGGLTIFVALLAAVPILLAVAIGLGGGMLHTIILAYAGYMHYTFWQYWGHRFAHVLAVAARSPGGIDAVLAEQRMPSLVSWFMKRLPILVDPEHFGHHERPGDADENTEYIVEDYGAFLLVQAMPATIVHSLLCTHAFRSFERLWWTKASDHAASVVSPMLLGWWPWPVPWLVSFGSAFAANAGGFCLGLLVYEVVHLSAHVRQEGQPAWLWAWSSMHRVHHRRPWVNYGFNHAFWDWCSGTLHIERSCCATQEPKRQEEALCSG